MNGSRRPAGRARLLATRVLMASFPGAWTLEGDDEYLEEHRLSTGAEFELCVESTMDRAD